VKDSQDAVQALLVAQSFGAEMSFSPEVFCVLLNWSQERSERTVRLLHRRGYIFTHRDHHQITEDGREYVAQAIAQMDVRGSTATWKDEALSGITLAGKRSKITRAVIPCPKHGTGRPRSPEDVVARAQQQRKEHAKEATRLGVTPDQLTAWIESGRVHICHGGKEPHAGVFDRNGKGWRSKCRECRKRLGGK